MKNKNVWIHADDYGLSRQTSAQILECCLKGQLDGISILPNFSCFEADMKALREAFPKFPKEVTCSVHLNLMEGPCLADKNEVTDLADETGFLCRSWGSLFLASFLPGRKKLQEQLEKEIAAQIQKVTRALGENRKIWVDGHQHTQMIPVVFDALCQVIQREGYQAVYIRNSAEPLWPFVKQLSLWKTYRPVNFVKNLILNLCAWYAEPKMRKLGCKPMCLWGLVMSGHMDSARVSRILPDMLEKAEKNQRQLEILFHPGSMAKEEINNEYNSAEALEFYFSEGRVIEKAALELVGR